MALTATCRAAYAARQTALLPAVWLLRRHPQRALIVAIKQLSGTPDEAAAGNGARCTGLRSGRAATPAPDGSGSGHTSLHVAAASGCLPIVQALLGAGADVNARRAMGATPLHWACRGGHVDAVRALIAAGARPSEADGLGLTPAHLAAVRGHASVLQALAQAAGACLHARTPAGRTALHGVCIAGQGVHVAELLLQRAPALAWARDDDGRLAHDWARERGHVDLVHALQTFMEGPQAALAEAAAAGGG